MLSPYAVRYSPTLPFWVRSATLVAFRLMMHAVGVTGMPPMAVQVAAGSDANPGMRTVCGRMSVALRN